MQALPLQDRSGNLCPRVRYRFLPSRDLAAASGCRANGNTQASITAGRFPVGSMLRSRDIRRLSATALLAVFLAGGLAAPVAHRAQHGNLAAARYADAPDACDHRHGVSYEEPVSDKLEDDCLLCIRPLAFDNPQTRPHAYIDFSPHAWHARLTPDSHLFSRNSIRGPPPGA